MPRRTSIHKTFRVYLNNGRPPRRRGRYYKVNVFKTRQGMLDYSRSIGHEVTKRGFTARTFQYFVPKRCKRGGVMFYRGGVDPETVAHEMLHVAVASTPKTRQKIFRRKPPYRDEERLCYLMDSLIGQFYKRYRGRRRAAR